MVIQYFIEGKFMKYNNSFNIISRFLCIIREIQTVPEYVKVFSQLMVLAGLLLGAALPITAQQNDLLLARHPSEFADDKPKKCFEYDLSLDHITQNTPTDKTIIVIARLGDKDTKPNLNKRRLHNIRAYWTQYLSEPVKRNSETIVLAEGEPIKGFGQVEFYVRGELVEILKLNPNTDFPSALCYMLPDETPCSEEKQRIFFPCKDKVGKQTQRRKVRTNKRSR